MELVKYRLQKKWWHSIGEYTVKDETGNVAFVTRPIGIFSTGFSIYNADKSKRLVKVISADWKGSKFDFVAEGKVVAELRKISSFFSMSEYLLTYEGEEVRIETQKWGKQINFTRDKKDVAHASLSSSFQTEIGLVLYADMDERVVILVVIILSYIRSNGS